MNWWNQCIRLALLGFHQDVAVESQTLSPHLI